MEYLAFLIVAVVVIFVIYIIGIAEEKKRIAWFRKKRAGMYGKASEKKYEKNRLQTLKRSAQYHYDKRSASADTDVFMIDDITWNDLDMDRVYQHMDFTVSSAGEDALYRWLRMPELNPDRLSERESHISFFSRQENERLDYQVYMSKVGSTGKYSLYDYLDFLDALSEKSCKKDILIDIAIFVFLFAGIFYKTVFIYVAIACMTYHGYDYFVQKKRIEPYFSSLSYLVKIIYATDSIQKMSQSFLDEFSDEMNTIRSYRKEFAAFVRGASFALDIQPITGAGDIFQLFISYIYMVFHFDLIKFYSMLHTVNEKKDDLVDLMQILGNMEACLSIAYFRAQLPAYVIPEFRLGSDKTFEAENLYHPLLNEPVKNDVRQSNGMLLTGSNASGKSTFLKTVALNALMAQTIHTVCADSYKAAFYRIYSSMALRDNLSDGESYFIVEIKSMKRIFDAAECFREPILCTIDEVLRGTNTAERIGASTELLKALSKKNVLCFAATHDLELTTYLKDDYSNYHFEECVSEKDIVFPYLLTAGPARGRNAIRLLKAYGFEPEIIEKANKLAGELS